MPEYVTLQVDRRDGVTTVALNRPEVHNAFNAKLIAELTAAFGEASDDKGTLCVILRGNGRSFCAGADVNWMRESLDLSAQQNMDDALRMSDMFAAINHCACPVIGRVHGAALGGGMGLAAACDIVVAADGARFGFTEAKLGIIPAVISRFVVSKIGSSWARRYFLTAERFDSATARQMGLVHEAVPEAELDGRIAQLVSEVHSSGCQAAREAKALIAGLRGLSDEDQRMFTAERIAAVRTSPEGQEGLRAFLEKREPNWESPQ